MGGGLPFWAEGHFPNFYSPPIAKNYVNQLFLKKGIDKARKR